MNIIVAVEMNNTDTDFLTPVLRDLKEAYGRDEKVNLGVINAAEWRYSKK